MTVVVGTAGHIDHGKTTLLRALTGIDADRLPEERRRGMTIDVGYAHLALDDGTAIDFVDVPGHDRLVGNMLVGAGEIDAAMLVVAADDGPRAQTLEHLALLDALGITAGLVVVTKIDTVAPERVAEVIAVARDLIATTSLTGSPVLAASGATGAGIGMVREALVALRDGVAFVDRPPTIAIDRVFLVKGRGAVVTGSLRGGPLARGDRLRLVPGDEDLRIREIQVHGEDVARVDVGGRTALNLAGIDAARLHRGQVLTADPAVRATDRILVNFRAPVADRARGRLHSGTAATDAAVGRSGRDDLTLPDGTIAGIVRLGEPVALRPGDRFVLRRGPTAASVGGTVLDTQPPRGISRRRQTPERVAALAGVDPLAVLSQPPPQSRGGALAREFGGGLPMVQFGCVEQQRDRAGPDPACVQGLPDAPEVHAQRIGIEGLGRLDRGAHPRDDGARVIAPRGLPPIARRLQGVKENERPPDAARGGAQVLEQLVVALRIDNQGGALMREDPRADPARRGDGLPGAGRAEPEQVLALPGRQPAAPVAG